MVHSCGYGDGMTTETDQTEALPAWQRGIPLADLKAATAVLAHTEAPYCQGAFTRTSERTVAEAVERGGLRAAYDGGISPQHMVALVLHRQVRARTPVKDFTGEVRAVMQPGDVHIQRMGCVPGSEEQVVELVRQVAQYLLPPGGRLWVTAWQEHRPHRELVEELGLHLVGVKIPASSELLGVYCTRHVEEGAPPVVPLPGPEVWGLRRLSMEPPIELLGHAAHEVLQLEEWAQHYSSYNRRGSWQALALRGYTPHDPTDITKPAEMSKSWKAEHPGWEELECEDTPLMEQLPAVAELAALVPGQHQRVRLMQLQPGGGELSRHADITDREAGTAEGHVLRIHVPLVSNEQVRFSSWSLEGEQYTRTMRVGEAWYLDTRKPHTAVNGGATPRVHLVVDVYSNRRLLELLERGDVGA